MPKTNETQTILKQLFDQLNRDNEAMDTFRASLRAFLYPEAPKTGAEYPNPEERLTEVMRTAEAAGHLIKF